MRSSMKAIRELIAVMAICVLFYLLRVRPAVDSDQQRLQEERSMTVTLNRGAFEHAKELINEGRIVLDERDAWSEHRPTAAQENEFIRLHGMTEYGRWYLGINNEKPEPTKG